MEPHNSPHEARKSLPTASLLGVARPGGMREAIKSRMVIVAIVAGVFCAPAVLKLL